METSGGPRAPAPGTREGTYHETQENSGSTLNLVGRTLLGAKSTVLKGVFYWAGRSMLEVFGRELVWAREKIAAEEMAKLKGRKLVKCENCGNYREIDR